MVVGWITCNSIDVCPVCRAPSSETECENSLTRRRGAEGEGQRVIYRRAAVMFPNTPTLDLPPMTVVSG